jgi:catechol 2,3-dioxygenase-like lactoylglutathione lyase family enzyme
MNQDPNGTHEVPRSYQVVGLGYMSLYMRDLEQAVAFYTRFFGPPILGGTDGEYYGWQMGSTWLTVFPSRGGTAPDHNPRNAEFAIQVSRPGEVDLLYQALTDAGAISCTQPLDTRMYDPMRFACVDDPFGVRLDIYCPLSESEKS